MYRHISKWMACAALLGGLCFSTGALAQTAQNDQGISAQDAAEIAREAYAYAYPLVLTEISRRVLTNVEAPEPIGHAPINQFGHMRAFPDATFTDIVRPNADTLYSILWFDVSNEPLVVSVADSGGRYYLLPMLDMWTDVFASPGKRTTGTGARAFAIVGPHWQGSLPAGVEEIRSPTEIGWSLGRTQTNGKADYDAVHRFQAGLRAIPLSQWGKAYTPPKGNVNPGQDMTAPVKQVENMDAATFFATFAQITKSNPPHANDYPILDRMKRIGIEPGKPFNANALAPVVKAALDEAPRQAMDHIKSAFDRSSRVTNGWQMIASPVGTYGTDYLKRAGVAYFGFGANMVEDAIYPGSLNGPEGRPFDSGMRYLVHFEKAQIPPVRAFWSLTMYDDRQLFTANPIDRYAIGDRDKLAFNPDGSLDLYVQRDSPGKDKESNWLPAPARGSFSMTMRLYWPKSEALDGTWSPPIIKEAGPSTVGQGR